VLERPGIRRDAPGRDRSATQRPKKTFVPLLALGRSLDVRKRTGDTLVGVVHGSIDWLAALRNEAVFFIPDVGRRFLERNGVDVLGFELHNAVHA